MTKILYVEDEPFLGKIVKESLESRGFEIFMVADGTKAIDEFHKSNPDLCVLDIMLPGRDGYSIGSEIKQIKSSMPIIFLTAKDQTEDIIKGFESGGNDYLKKPFSIEELIVRINNLLRLTSHYSISQENHLYHFGDFEFNHTNLELIRGQDITKLSHREAELLKVLLEGHKEAIDRTYILKSIWGDDSFFNSRNLDVYIRKLRRHLAEDPSVKILTLKGVGYRFIH